MHAMLRDFETDISSDNKF